MSSTLAQRQVFDWRSWQGDVAALFAGALLPLSLAPFNIWPAGIIAPMLLALLLIPLGSRRGFIRALVFGVGLFGVGASWVFRSIYDFGFATLPLALILTALFVFGLALVFAFPFYLYCRFLNRNRWGFLLGFVCVWTLGEWSRSWFLTGFPWLYVGYAHSNTWLAGWAPIGGVFCLSFFAVASGVVLSDSLIQLAKAIKHKTSCKYQLVTNLVANGVIVAIWLSGLWLSNIEWTDKQENPANVSIVQPNIPQHYKWQPYYYPYIMQTMRDLSEATWKDSDILLWPENAIPLFYHEAEAFLEELELRAYASNTAFISGILYDADEPRTWYNSIIGLGNAEGTYFKQRLVPFGEYVPLEHYLRGVIDFFDLPRSVISAGDVGQQPLKTHDYAIASSICYEVVYPSLVAEYARDAGLLVTISNDAWFGDSIGPIQHFQMAQMRALENGKFMLRATNTGVSGILSHKGELISALPQFEQGTLRGQAYLMLGQTPFSKWLSWPIILICFTGVFVVALIQRRQAH